jgi:hypothetical protein
MKLTKSQTKNLNRIWTEKVAYMLVSADRSYSTQIDSKTCAATGFAKMHLSGAASLVSKGLATVLTTKTDYTTKTGTFRVQVLVLTDAGRAAIGV